MNGATLPGAVADRRLRFALAVQKSRLAVYALACVIGVLGYFAGALRVSAAAALTHVVACLLSAVVFHELYRHGVDRRFGLDLRPLWMGIDVVFITLAVALSGGLDSPWYPWYLANVSAAAFVGGRRAALAVAAADAVAYVAVLATLGEVRGFDAGLALALMRLAVLGSASFFFVRGILALQEEQRLVRRLRDEQAAQLDHLTALTQDLEQGTYALAEANIRIREADHLKSQFLANMSHELRTPLNSIIGFSEILGDRLADQISPRHLKFLHNIQASGQHLLGIINDILDLSKIESGKMELLREPLRVPTIIEGVLSVMHGISAGRGIVLDVDAPEELPSLEADPAKLKQILYNLLSNAVKFSPEGGTVRVVARYLPAPASPLGVAALAVSVIDHGIGIDPADQEVVFHEFRQVDSAATRAYGGTGLGLTLVKKLVELHQGTLALESELHRGSTFSFTLPLRASEAGERETRHDREAARAS